METILDMECYRIVGDWNLISHAQGLHTILLEGNLPPRETRLVSRLILHFLAFFTTVIRFQAFTPRNLSTSHKRIKI